MILQITLPAYTIHLDAEAVLNKVPTIMYKIRKIRNSVWDTTSIRESDLLKETLAILDEKNNVEIGRDDGVIESSNPENDTIHSASVIVTPSYVWGGKKSETPGNIIGIRVFSAFILIISCFTIGLTLFHDDSRDIEYWQFYSYSIISLFTTICIGLLGDLKPTHGVREVKDNTSSPSFICMCINIFICAFGLIANSYNEF